MILRSIVITSFVSILFAFGLRNVFGFWETLALAFILQVVVAFIFSSFKINKVNNLTAEFENELQQLLDLNETTIICPCNNYTFTDNIFVNMDNTYTCEKCNNTYRIDVSVVPTLLTEPVNIDKTFDDLSKQVEVSSEHIEGTEL